MSDHNAGSEYSSELVQRYNYDEFVPEKFEPLLNFKSSPPVGQAAIDFPLWRLEDRVQIRLSDLIDQFRYTVVEFGSFT